MQMNDLIVDLNPKYAIENPCLVGQTGIPTQKNCAEGIPLG